MGQIAVAVKHLMAAGITGDALVRAIEDMEAETLPPPKKKRDPNSPGAIRQKRYRENGGGSSQGVTGAEVTDVTSQGVTEASQGVTETSGEPLSPHTPLSENINISTTREAREADRDQLEADCRNWANGSLVDGFDGAGIAVIERLLDPPEGSVPCNRDDVRVGISDTAAMLRAKGKRGEIATLSYFEEPILRARDKRLTPLRKVEIPNERAGQSQSGKNSNGGGGVRARPGREQRTSNFDLAYLGLFGGGETQTELPDEPQNGRTEWVA